MTIDFNNPNLNRRVGDSQLERNAGTSAGNAVPNADRTEPSSSADPVNLSSNAQSWKSLEAKIHTFPEVNQAKVESIRAAIAEGRYHIDPVRLAERFIALESELEA